MDPAIRCWVLLAVKLAIRALEFFTDLLFGATFTRGSRNEREEATARGFDRSAHVVSVLWRERYAAVDNHLFSYYLYRHVRYGDPQEEILNRKGAVLFYVGTGHAVFAVSDEPDADFYDTERHPFVQQAVFIETDKLVFVPIDAFHRLAEKQGVPKVPVIIIGNTGRCGSTLLNQILHRLPDTRSVSEPVSLVSIYMNYQKGAITHDEMLALVRSALRLELKVSPGDPARRIGVKLCTDTSVLVGDVKALFPDFKFVFNARMPAANAESWMKVVATLRDSLYYRTGAFHRARLFYIQFPYDRSRNRGRVSRYFPADCSDEEAIFGNCRLGLASYFQNPGVYSHTILYENLVGEDPAGEVEKFFRAADIPQELVSIGMEAMAKNSHNGLYSSKSSAIGPEGRAAIDRMLADWDIPVRCDMSFKEFEKLFEQ